MKFTPSIGGSRKVVLEAKAKPITRKNWIYKWYYKVADEFEPFAARCRFRNCTHLHEPDCAVRAAAGDGVVSARYESYRLLAETMPKTRT